MKQSALVYAVAAVVGLIVLQILFSLFMSALPAILFLLGSVVALLCGYAIMTERGNRIDAVDRLLGIGGTREPVAVPASVSATNIKDGAPDRVDDGAPQGGATKMPVSGNGDAHEPVGEPPDLHAYEQQTDVPGNFPRPPEPPPTTTHIDYGSLIEEIKAQPVTLLEPPSPASAPASNPKSSPSPSRSGIDYSDLVSKLQSTRPAIPTKEELVAAIGSKVIGQRPAIETIATYVRGKLGAKDTGKNKPLVFLLPGPTGTGKTELSKAIAEALGTKLARFDMGEYGEEYKASNLFGSPKGYIGSEDGGALPNALRQGGKRFVALFDEVEKAHQSIWQKLLAFMDEGRCGDSKGDVVAPKDTIILLTTNRCAEQVGKNPENAKDILRHDGYFSPEFLGRVEKIVPMPRLTDADMMQLTHRLLDVLAQSYGLSIAVDDESLMALYAAARDNAERAGGRGITETLKDLLIEDLLELQGGGHEIGRLVVEEDRVRAIPA